MKQLKKTIIGLVILVTSVFSISQAQYGMDPMMGMHQLMYEGQMQQMQLQQWNMQMEMMMQQQMQLAQQNVDHAFAQMEKFYIDYYRQHTGDSTTPDHIAVQLGDQLFCQHHPQQCQQQAQHMNRMSQISAQGHQQNMQDIAAWGNTMRNVAQTNNEILDMQHQSYMERSEMQSQGFDNYTQGVIFEESTYVNPSGVGYSLPYYPDQNTQYSTPDGSPLHFDYSTSTWYQWDGYGSWIQLQQQR